VVGQPLGQSMGEESSGNLPSPVGSARAVREAPGRREQVSSAEAAEQRWERTPEASAPGAAAPRPKEGAPLLGVKAPHPDDDVTPRVWNSSVSKFFQRKYDLYLEHYEGYVRLAERTYRMQDEAGESPGTLRTREWDDKLRRLHDAMDRTTQRLDVLEHHYPELATDSDRLSDRLAIARLQSELAERFGRWG
jgi:hypothetical protein